MKKLAIVLSLVLGAALFHGCASIEIVEKEPNMVEVSNSGCYLFYFIPLFSGDIHCPNQPEPVVFRNTVSVANNLKLLDWVAKKNGATGYRDVVSHLDDERVILLLLKRKILHTSAVLVK